MFLLETNVISELRIGKPQLAATVRNWAAEQPKQHLYLSAITVLKLELGVLRMERRDRAQSEILRTWVDGVFQQFEGQVLPFGTKGALRCAAMHVPYPKCVRVSMLAATALDTA